MALPNIFEKKITDQIIDRINQLTANTPPLWGKMGVAEMLAHYTVSYEMVYTDKHPKPNFLIKLILKSFIKKAVTNETPYSKNSTTAPVFLIRDSRNFDQEKTRLIDFINKTQELGAKHFDQKESNSFGPLSEQEWNNMFYKHLDHHLTQFGV